MIVMPNLLLIAGNGRNAGKTTLACRIIRFLAQENEVTGVKISSHFHNFNEPDLVYRNDHFIVTEEKQMISKDSSLMLQAGAKKVYFVMAQKEHLEEAWKYIHPLIRKQPVVCESGGLHEFVEPGLFLFVKRTGDEIVKKHLTSYSPVMVNNDGSEFDFDINKIEIHCGQFRLKQ